LLTAGFQYGNLPCINYEAGDFQMRRLPAHLLNAETGKAICGNPRAWVKVTAAEFASDGFRCKACEKSLQKMEAA
jgi:hypothetical protein